MKGLYIHIPFCDHICVYCDFVKEIAKESIKNKYIDALNKEIMEKLAKGYLDDIDTIYIGGGTPSSLSIAQLSSLLSTLDKVTARNQIKEYTIEANPKDIKEELLNLLHTHNINRLSLGVQSFNDDKLVRIRRNHTKKDAIAAIKLAKNYFDNISIDLIYGFEIDNYTLMKKDILKAKSLGVKHISCYSLILEKRSILKNELEKGLFKLMDEDKEANLYYKLTNLLESLDYHHYEISNYSMEGYESLHNQIYWNNELYEACGTGAASYIYDKNKNEYRRRKNIVQTTAYIKEFNNYQIQLENILDKEEDENLSFDDRIDYEILCGLRMIKGINKKQFIKRYGSDIRTRYPHINDYIKQGLLVENDEYIAINPDHFYISNAIIRKVFSERKPRDIHNDF